MQINHISYNIKGILYRKWDQVTNHGLLLNTQPKMIENIFRIKACIEQDIYNLYCKGNKSDYEFYGHAHIADYKTSVIMNKYFRYIKENTNLDLLEESDDEEEFENINEDKFVNLKKIIYMKCIYIKKFRKWKPIELVQFGEKLLTKREIQQLENNN